MKYKEYGIWAVRSGNSIFGSAEAWYKNNGVPIKFSSEKEAQEYADNLNKTATANCSYFVKEMKDFNAF